MTKPLYSPVHTHLSTPVCSHRWEDLFSLHAFLKPNKNLRQLHQQADSLCRTTPSPKARSFTHISICIYFQENEQVNEKLFKNRVREPTLMPFCVYPLIQRDSERPLGLDLPPSQTAPSSPLFPALAARVFHHPSRWQPSLAGFPCWSIGRFGPQFLGNRSSLSPPPPLPFFSLLSADLEHFYRICHLCVDGPASHFQQRFMQPHTVLRKKIDRKHKDLNECFYICIVIFFKKERKEMGLDSVYSC